MKLSNVVRLLVVLGPTLCFGVTACGPAATLDGEDVTTTEEASTVMPGDRAFAASGNLTGIAQTNPLLSFNSGGGTMWVHHLGILGRYRVDIPNLGGTAGGHVQVMSRTNNADRCKVRSWGAVGTTLQVYVDCTTGQGLPSDSLFSLNYVRRSDTPGPEGAYVWAFDPLSPSYNATSLWSWNSTGQTITISRGGTGSYTVMPQGQNLNGGTVEVTAYGSGNAHCKVKNWSSSGINVICFDGHSGLATDSMFTMLFSRRSPNGTASFSYLWANQAGGLYTPDPFYRFDLVDVASSSQPGDVSPDPFIQSISNGDHVTFPYMAANAATPSNVKVTGYGPGNDTCKSFAWGGITSTDAAAMVACFAANGRQVFARYTITYSSLAWVP